MGEANVPTECDGRALKVWARRISAHVAIHNFRSYLATGSSPLPHPAAT